MYVCMYVCMYNLNLALFRTVIFYALINVLCVLQLPFACVNSLLFCAVLYPMTGFLSSVEAFLFFYLVMTITTIAGLFIAQVAQHLHHHSVDVAQYVCMHACMYE